MAYNFSDFNRQVAYHNRIVNSLAKKLKEQEKFGNLNATGKTLLYETNPATGRKYLVEQAERIIAYRKNTRMSGEDIDPLNQEILQFTSTGYVAKELTSKRTGKTYTRYGRETSGVFKAAKLAAGDSGYIEVKLTKMVARNKWNEELIKLPVNNIRDFVASSDRRTAIAVRIQVLGEERQSVLADYGY